MSFRIGESNCKVFFFSVVEKKGEIIMGNFYQKRGAVILENGGTNWHVT